MKKHLLYIFSIIFILAVIIAGSILRRTNLKNNQPDSNDPDANAPQSLSMRQIYQEAANAVNAAQNLVLSVDTSVQTQIGEETFTERSAQALRLTGRGTDSVSSHLSETVTIGTYTITSTQIYTNGTAYLQIEDAGFRSSISSDAYLSGLTPAVLLDASLYDTVTHMETDTGTTLSFNDPKGPEHWALEDDAVLTMAEGKAFLSKENQLTASEYTVIYHHNTATVKKTVRVSVSMEDTTIPTPVEADYISVTDPEAVLLLEKACGYLIQSKSISATSSETILCELNGDTRTKSIELDMYENRDGFAARLRVDISLANSSWGNEPEKESETIQYLNGKCTITNPTGDTDRTITAEELRQSCQNLLLGTILLPSNISDAQINDLGDTLQITFAGNEAFAQSILENISRTLYQDSNIFEQLAPYYSTQALTCYLTIDKHTGMPVASGVSFRGTHSINEYTYLAAYEAEQVYTIASTTAYSNITK